MADRSDLQTAVSHWHAAESRLYPVVMTRPDLYEQCIRLVRAIADDLRSARTTDGLLDAYSHAGEVVADVVRHTQLSTEGIDLGLVTGAAFSMRYRDLLEELHREESIRRIREGRERNAKWVTLYDTGSPRGPMPLYRRLEMRLADGTGLHAFVEPNPDTGGPLFGVELVQLDPQTGDWLNDVPPLMERRTFDTTEAWEEAISAIGRQPSANG